MRNITNDYLTMVTGLERVNEGFWSNYKDSKEEFLNGLFKGKSIIEKEVAVEKSITDIKNSILEAKLHRAIDEAIDVTIKQFLDDLCYVPTWQMTDEQKIQSRTRYMVNSVISNSHLLASQVMNEDIEFYSPITKKNVKVQKGMKMTKVWKHFITDKEKLNKLQVLYSQILNDKMLRGTLCLSIHPMDYLTASVNEAGWSSCYDTLDKGQYCASTLCLINSPNSIMVYLKSKQDGSYGYGSPITWNSKKWRTFITLSEDCQVVHFGRNYPYENNPLMEAAREMVQELTGMTYGPITESTGKVKISTPDNMYNDADCGGLYVAMTGKYELGLPIYGPKHISISQGATCPCCGEMFEGVAHDLLCPSCGNYDTCSDCGDIITEGDSCYVDSLDCYVCECCYDNHYSYCEECNNSMPDDDLIAYQSHYNESTGRMYTDYMCRTCADEKLEECSCCGELTDTEYIREDGTCFACDPLEQEEEEEQE